MIGLDHLPPPFDAHRPEAFAKKSRSTSSWPILACSFSTSASVDFAVSSASDANDFEGEHQIYQEDAVLEYPQSGERIRGRRTIQSSRAAQPNRKRFTVRRIIGAGDLWDTEYVLTYDGRR
jgi:hypothetical protein